jgi:hypothetical protein
MCGADLQERLCMPTSIDSEIRSRVQAFADEIIALIRASAVDIVNVALAGTAARSRRDGAVTARTSTRPKGAKRDPAAIARLTDTLGTFIKKNPGQRIEQIGKALGIRTKELALPVKKLLAAKQISTKGRSVLRNTFRDRSLRRAALRHGMQEPPRPVRATGVLGLRMRNRRISLGFGQALPCTTLPRIAVPSAPSAMTTASAKSSFVCTSSNWEAIAGSTARIAGTTGCTFSGNQP